MPQLTRRRFVQTVSAGCFAGALALPGKWSSAGIIGANAKLRIGMIGVTGRGGANLNAFGQEEIAALCDVDENRLNGAAERFPQAHKFVDYRELIEMPDLDAVVVSTPDHHHAPAAMRAMRRGLHVYCEKPLTHTVEEAFALADAAAEFDVITQMGTQNHQHPGYLKTVSYVRGGVLGPVKEIHVHTDRPGRFWQQGMQTPAQTPPIPEHLHWDLWLGPAAERAYHPAYVPFAWRGWWDFGCGAIGDMAIHLMDPSVMAFNLHERQATITVRGPEPRPDSGPKWMEADFEFAETSTMPAVKLTWYEGETEPPDDIAKDLPTNGTLFIGERGRLRVEHNELPSLLPERNFAGVQLPEPRESSPGHHQQWVEACKSGEKASSDFSYAGPFTALIHMGNIAFRSGGTVKWDPESRTIEGPKAAQALLRKDYREGWEIAAPAEHPV